MLFNTEREKSLWINYYSRELSALEANDALGRASVSVTDRDDQVVVLECLIVLKSREHGLYHQDGRLYHLETDGAPSPLTPVTAAKMKAILTQHVRFYRRPRNRPSAEPVNIPSRVPKLLIEQGRSILARYFPDLAAIPTERIAETPVVRALIGLRDVTEGSEWTGSYRTLYEALEPYRDDDPNWPGSDSALSRLMKSLAAPMKGIGITLTDLPRDKSGSRVRVTWDDRATAPAEPGAGDVGIPQRQAETCTEAYAEPVQAM